MGWGFGEGALGGVEIGRCFGVCLETGGWEVPGRVLWLGRVYNVRLGVLVASEEDWGGPYPRKQPQCCPQLHHMNTRRPAPPPLP